MSHANAYRVDRDARTARRRTPRKLPRTHTMQRESDGALEVVETNRALSPEAAELDVVVAQLGQVFRDTISFYKSERFGSLSHADAVKHSEEMEAFRLKCAREKPARDLDWDEIAALTQIDVREGLDAWRRVKEAAENDLESGYRASKVLGYNPSAWQLAQFLAIRDTFCDEWQPRGGIESAMIDMMAVAFSLQLYWSTIAHERVTSDHDEQKRELQRYESHGWKSPYQRHADAVEQAHRLADGYNRQFLRVLRQLRDLRRYAPSVIVNNGGQVNVANQQVNVAGPASIR